MANRGNNPGNPNASGWYTASMTDMQALAQARDVNGNLIFDTNGDGVLNASDTSWGELKV